MKTTEDSRERLRNMAWANGIMDSRDCLTIQVLEDVRDLLAENVKISARLQAAEARTLMDEELIQRLGPMVLAAEAEVERLKTTLQEACTHLDMAVEASEESGDLDKEEAQEERDFIGRCRAALGGPPTSDSVTQNLVAFSGKNFP